MTVQSERVAPWSQEDAVLGSGVYTRLVLNLYDPLVIGFENTFVWRCPSSEILAFYNRYISGNHLDVGVGTGYYLDKCHFPTATPSIALLDLNPNSLRATAKRIRRYQPAVYKANILEPIALHLPQFNTIGMNFLLHCLPGTLASKGVVFKHLKQYLKPEGIFFGSTILGQGVRFGLLGKVFMRAYNSYLIPRSRVLYNVNDRLEDLQCSLAEHFERHSLFVKGTVVFFVASHPRYDQIG